MFTIGQTVKTNKSFGTKYSNVCGTVEAGPVKINGVSNQFAIRFADGTVEHWHCDRLKAVK